MSKTQAPTLGAPSFNCPYAECATHSHQSWFIVYAKAAGYPPYLYDYDKVKATLIKWQHEGAKETDISWAEQIICDEPFLYHKENEWASSCLEQVYLSQCFSCKRFAIWRLVKLVSPNVSVELVPNADMPADAAKDFREAAEIFHLSPRASAALLRLSLQKILPTVGGSGDNINKDIKSLVAKGLPVQIQQALDVVRVVGNNAVHPGQIDIGDDSDIALKLFSLLNVIVDSMITQPKIIASMFGDLPADAISAIEKRDGKL